MTYDEFKSIYGRSAFDMVRAGYTFKDSEILSIKHPSGITVAHSMANDGYEFIDSEILRLTTNSGWSVAHAMARCGHVFDETNEKYVLMLQTQQGLSVAHVQVYNGNHITDPELLALTNDDNWSVAHYMALNTDSHLFIDFNEYNDKSKSNPMSNVTPKQLFEYINGPIV